MGSSQAWIGKGAVQRQERTPYISTEQQQVVRGLQLQTSTIGATLSLKGKRGGTRFKNRLVQRNGHCGTTPLTGRALEQFSPHIFVGDCSHLCLPVAQHYQVRFATICVVSCCVVLFSCVVVCLFFVLCCVVLCFSFSFFFGVPFGVGEGGGWTPPSASWTGLLTHPLGSVLQDQYGIV